MTKELALKTLFSSFFNKNLCILYLLTTFAPRYANNDEIYKAHEEAIHTMGRLSTALYNKIFKKAFPHRKAFLLGLCVMKSLSKGTLLTGPG